MTARDANSSADSSASSPDRATLLRDIVVLQFKLVVDGLRDFILVPVSLATGLVSLLRRGDRPGTEFYDLLRYGRHTDRVINLFGAAERVHEPYEEEAPTADIDEFVNRVETFVVEEYRRGEVTAQARQRFDALRDALRRRTPPTDNVRPDDDAMQR